MHDKYYLTIWIIDTIFDLDLLIVLLSVAGSLVPETLKGLRVAKYMFVTDVRIYDNCSAFQNPIS